MKMRITDKIMGLFKREVPVSEFESMFSRMDLGEFFNSLSNLWAPGELIDKLGGYENLHLLYKDHDIFSSVDKRISALLTTKMSLEGTDERLVKFFEEQILPHERQLKQDLWWTVFNGWGIEQIIYSEDASGKIDGFQREEFWRFEPQKDLIHVKLVTSGNPLYRNKILPYGKWVLTTNNGTSYNPMGDAMAERLIMPWIFKCNGWDLWMDFSKRFANGFMHGKISDIDKKEAMREALEKAGKSSIFVTDKDTELILNQPSRDSTLYTSIDDRTVRAIQKVVLGETQSSDMMERGSSGSAAVHNEVRQEKTWADIELVQKGINEIIRQIGDVNGFDPKSLPKAVLSWDPGFSTEQASRDNTLHGMGIRFTKSYFVKTYGLDEEDFEIKEPEVSFPSFSQKKKSFLSLKDMQDFIGIKRTDHVCSPDLKLDASVSRKSRRQETEKEEIVSLLSRSSSPPIDPDDMIAAIMTSKNQNELDEKLLALFDSKNNGFVEDMAKGLYLAAARGAMMGNPEVIDNEEV